MSGVKKAPDFEKKPNCQKCNASFGFLTRQHHCRNCGKSFCEKCSNRTLPIPQYGFVEPVRCCDPCFAVIQSSAARGPAKAAPKAEAKETPTPASPTAATTTPASPTAAATTAGPPGGAPTAAAAPSTTTTTKPRSDSADEAIRDVAPTAPPPKKVTRCVCGLPFCICPADKTEEKKEDKKAERPKAAPAPAKRVETAPSAAPSGSFAGFGRQKAKPTYDMKGDLNEQAREAIKAGDKDGVVSLLAARADPRFIDRTGNSLVHLAAMFNQLDVVTLLVKSGANIWEKNPAGETPVDLAPPSLANKMKELQPPAGAAGAGAAAATS